MPSAINPNVPVAGNPTTASVRANFATAAQEITTLQDNTQGAPFLPLAGAQMRGPINLFNDPTAPMHPVTLGYFQANGGGGGGGGGGVPEAPADGTLYGREDGAWQPAVNTAQLNAAITAAPFLPIAGGTLTGMLTLSGPPTIALHAASKGYVDSNFLNLAGGTLSGPLILAADPATALGAATKQYIDVKNYVSQVGPTLNVGVVEQTTGANKAPSICGPVTPYNSASDVLLVAARRLATPTSGGLWTEGAFLGLYGPSASPPNAVILFAGNNTAGHQQFVFNPDGSTVLPGTASIGNGSTPAPTFPVLRLFTSGNYAAIRFNASGVRAWDVGLIQDGNFNFYDWTAGAYRASITTYGSLQINPVGGVNSFIANGGNGIQFTFNCPYGTNNGYVFAWNAPNGGVVNVSLDGGTVVQGLQPVSDARMKDDIVLSRFDCLATALQIPLHAFRWRDASDPERIATTKPLADAPLMRVGLIAQEVAQVFPEGVMQGDDTTDTLGHLWQIEANIMLALLVGATKQLDARLVALEARGH